MQKKAETRIWAAIIAFFCLFYLTGIMLPVFVNAAATPSKGLIVIDPGHDQADPGAVVPGYEERYINTQLSYKIAKELQNRGYEVWFSHSIFYDPNTPQDIPCLLPPKTGSKYDISTERVPAINQKDPDLAISIHHNAASSSSASGIEVYWRSDGTNPAIHQKSQDLGNAIYRHASSLDYINGRYGGVQDSMFLICKTNVPTVLFEAGYMTNPTELQNITNPEQQQKMAGAVADAIDEYFSVYPSTHATYIPATFDHADAVRLDENSSLVTVYATGVTSPYGIASVQFPTFIPGQKDAVWYDGVYIGNQTWAYTYDAGEHPGEYVTHVYATDGKGYQTPLCATESVSVSDSATPKANQVYTMNADQAQTQFLTIADNVSVDSGVAGVDMACFAPNSQTPVWTTAFNTGVNTYIATFDIGTFERKAGVYTVDCYAHPSSNPSLSIGIASATSVIPGPTADDVSVSINLDGSGAFRVIASGVSSVGTVTDVKIPVWCAPDQSDIVWYDASYAGNNTWTADVNIVNHQYHTGTYQAHAYAYDDRGTGAFIGNTSVEVAPIDVNPSIKVTPNYNESVFVITATGVPNNVSSVSFPVWTESGGQDDLIWYNGRKMSPNVWECEVPIQNHNYETGDYRADVYLTQNGVVSGFGSTTFTVDPITASSVDVINQDQTYGKFQVEITGVTSPATVTQVQVPVWSAPDQSDIYWYQAQNMGDGRWVADVDIANHQYHTGNYMIHAYASDSRGVCSLIGATETFIQPTTGITVKPNEDESVFTITASGVPGDVSSVAFPVWTEAGGQDDLIWYDGKKVASNVWKCYVPIQNHNCETGDYRADVYLTQNGVVSGFGSTTFTVDPITASSVDVINQDQTDGKFQVEITGVTSPSTVTQVQVPVWSAPDQSDIYWYQAQNMGNGCWVADVDIANHQNHLGDYQIHAYATDLRNVMSFVGATSTTVSFQGTTIQGNSEQSMFTATATEVPGNTTEVDFEVWTQANGQDDIVCYRGVQTAPNTWTATISISDHYYETGQYEVHTYITVGGVRTLFHQTAFQVAPTTASGVQITNFNDLSGSFTVEVSGIVSPSSVTSVVIPVWCDPNQSDIVWYTAQPVGNNTWRADVCITNHQNHTGNYTVHAYAYDSRGTCQLVANTGVAISAKMPITGAAQTSVQQMVNYFNRNAPGGYPEFYRTHGGAPDIQTFCQIYYEEATREGIRPEIAFAQCMKETGFLRFGGDVKIEQFNFAGIGATGNGNPGNSFPDVRTGVRAHIQHLKAYASTDPLTQECVDPRFNYVTRGVAPYVEWLAIAANPYHVGWASDPNYGVSIVAMVQNLLQC